MMRKTIVRTMATSTIKAYTVEMENGLPVAKALEPITIMGKAKEKDALKAVKEQYGKVAVTIGEIQIEEATYEISVDDFMKYAKKVEADKAQEETEQDDKEVVVSKKQKTKQRKGR